MKTQLTPAPSAQVPAYDAFAFPPRFNADVAFNEALHSQTVSALSKLPL